VWSNGKILINKERSKNILKKNPVASNVNGNMHGKTRRAYTIFEPETLKKH
jgi:hypothetical protein